MTTEHETNYTVWRRPVGSRVWTTEGGSRHCLERAEKKAADVMRQYPDSDVAITSCQLPKEPSAKSPQLFRLYDRQ